MNIREAARQLELTVRGYSMKTQEGNYAIPKAAQRPVYLSGPPGVGKTAVVGQVAHRLGIGFAAYTMTHHTRQSAIGLPVIEHRRFGGEEYAVTEYTMSEIIASVWEQEENRKALSEETGKTGGILFLDEINCVSETLMPAMLQFLQYKTFGRHGLPEGWVIVCAGNPVKYNRFAREFDPVIQDRIRRIDVEPDLDAWQQFASEHGVHPSIRSYLHLRPEDFYTADEGNMVTARSWTDLSDMMRAMEKMGERVDGKLFSQYLQCNAAAERFAMYYTLCRSVQEKGFLDDVLEGKAFEMRAASGFDETLFAVLMLAGKLESMAESFGRAKNESERLTNFVDGIARDNELAPGAACTVHLQRMEQALEVRRSAGAMTEAEYAREQHLLSKLRQTAARAAGANEKGMLELLRQIAEETAQPVKEREERLFRAMTCAFDFLERCVDNANIRRIFLKDLETNEAAAVFLRKHDPERFRMLLQRDDPGVRAERLRQKMSAEVE